MKHMVSRILEDVGQILPRHFIAQSTCHKRAVFFDVRDCCCYGQPDEDDSEPTATYVLLQTTGILRVIFKNKGD